MKNPISIYTCKTQQNNYLKAIFVVWGMLWLQGTYAQKVKVIAPNIQGQKHLAGTLKDLHVSLEKVDTNQTLMMVWNSRFSTSVLTADINGNEAHFSIPPALNSVRGQTEIILNYDNKNIARYEFYITADKAVGVIDAYLDPKTVNVDSLSPALLMLVPKDQYQNPVETQTAVNCNINFPASGIEQNIIHTENLMAYKLINAPAHTGKIFFGANADFAYCKEQELLVEPGNATNFEIKAIDQYPFADQRQNTTINTSIITDKYGNTIADGTAVDFLVILNDNQKSNYRSFTVNGVATVAIQNPHKSGTLQIQAIIQPQAKSNIQNLLYKSAVQSIKVTYKNKTISVGPVLNVLGQLYTNGAKVKFEMQEGNQVFYSLLKDGFAELNLNDIQLNEQELKSCIVRIGGLSKTINFE